MQSAGVLGLCGAGCMGFGAMNGALAAPPAVPRATFHLDLRPSVASLAAVVKLGTDMPAEAFPSSLHPSLHRQAWEAQTPLQLPALGAQGPQPRIPGRIEEFARRVHKEGLPVARLWENKSALVSLGLNQKGKPGLWIVQKIH